jgi:Cutinase
VAICLLAAFTVSALAFSAAASPKTASAACADVVYVGAAGSGELNDAAAGDYRRMGPEVYRMASVLESALAAKQLTMSRMPVGYPADSVGDLLPSPGEIAGLRLGPGGIALSLAHYKHFHFDKYIASIDAGIAATVRIAKDLATNCPTSAIVLAGYSQGAMVVHQAELRLAAGGRTDVLGHIAGTLLLGDGDRAAGTKAKLFGTSSAGAEGVRTYLHGNDRKDVVFPGRTASICNSHDIVCDFNLRTLRHPLRAKDVHTTYAKKDGRGRASSYSPLLTQAPRWLANKIAPGLGDVIFDGSPGTGPPPSTLGPYTMSPFGADTQPVGPVSGVAGPTGSLTFPTPLTHLLVEQGWQTWSNGYRGDVYVSDNSNTATVQLPLGTRAFYLYAEPNIFQDFNVSATTSDGTTSGPVTVYGESGAAYFGFYATGGQQLSEITVAADDLVAIGEFGISK